MNRRELFQATALSGLTLATLDSPAADNPVPTPRRTGKHVHDALPGLYRDLVRTSSACVSTGDVCLSHCLKLLAEGNTELAACARTVRDTKPAPHAVHCSRSQRPTRLAPVARESCPQICEDYQAECPGMSIIPNRDCEKAGQVASSLRQGWLNTPAIAARPGRGSHFVIGLRHRHGVDHFLGRSPDRASSERRLWVIFDRELRHHGALRAIQVCDQRQRQVHAGYTPADVQYLPSRTHVAARRWLLAARACAETPSRL